MYVIDWQQGPRGLRFSRRWEPEPWEAGLAIPAVEPRLTLADIPTGKYDDILYAHVPLPDPDAAFSMTNTGAESVPERQNTVDVLVRTTGLSDVKTAFREETGRDLRMEYSRRTIRSYEVGGPDEAHGGWRPDLLDLTDDQLVRFSRRMPIVGEDPISVAYYKAMRAYGLDPYEDKVRWWDVVNWEEYVERGRTWQWAGPDEVRELR